MDILGALILDANLVRPVTGFNEIVMFITGGGRRKKPRAASNAWLW
jgi:hypothetical protein